MDTEGKGGERVTRLLFLDLSRFPLQDQEKGVVDSRVEGRREKVRLPDPLPPPSTPGVTRQREGEREERKTRQTHKTKWREEKKEQKRETV